LLIDNGAEVNDEYVCCMGSDTALTLAIRKKDIEMVRFLLSRGADASCTARVEPYPSVLHEAIESRDRNIILAVLAALIIF
jgi:ankyrin repeat protein